MSFIKGISHKSEETSIWLNHQSVKMNFHASRNQKRVCFLTSVTYIVAVVKRMKNMVLSSKVKTKSDYKVATVRTNMSSFQGQRKSKYHQSKNLQTKNQINVLATYKKRSKED